MFKTKQAITAGLPEACRYVPVFRIFPHFAAQRDCCISRVIKGTRVVKGLRYFSGTIVDEKSTWKVPRCGDRDGILADSLAARRDST